MSEPTPLPLSVAIVGGGLHGTHLAARLVHADLVPRESIRIFDPEPELLALWNRRVARTGMTHLRSPAVHHLDVEPASLLRFCERSKRTFPRPYIPPYNRPSVELFAAHSAHVIKRFALDELHQRLHITGIELVGEGVALHSADGRSQRARHVILATGNGERLAWPSWTAALRGSGRVEHILSPEQGVRELDVVGRAAIIGGGLSAGQFALRLVDAGVETTIISPHGPRSHDFDSDPGWLGPKYMDGFGRVRCMSERRKIITQARNTGTLTKEIYAQIRWALEEGKAEWLRESVQAVTVGDAVHLVLENSQVEVDRVFLSTGFGTEVPSEPLIRPLIDNHALPVSECGFPVPDRSLRWGGSGIFVAGALAELELGPSARNISGARRAAERIVGALTAGSKWRAVQRDVINSNHASSNSPNEDRVAQSA